MAIVRETVGTTLAASQANPTLSKPTGVAVDDVMVAVFEIQRNTTSADPITAAPTGWLRATDSGVAASLNVNWLYVYYKVAVSSDTSATTYAWTGDGTGRQVAGDIVRLSGVDTGTPLDATPPAPTVASNSASCVCPTITTVTDNAWILRIAGSNLTAATYTYPGGTTEYLDNGGTISLACGDSFKTPAGATGTITVTQSVKGVNYGMTVAVRPATAVAAAVIPNVNMAPIAG